MRRKRQGSLSRRIFTLMAILVALQSLALLFSLFASQVFLQLDREAFRVFENTASNRVDKFVEDTDVLLRHGSSSATVLANEMTSILSNSGYDSKNYTQSDKLYEQVSGTTINTILSFLRNNNATGCFVIYNGSNADKANTNRHSAIYIRNTSPDITTSDNQNFQAEIAPATVARDYGIHIGPNWAIDFEMNKANPLYDIYHKPIDISSAYPKSELLRYGFWSTPQKVLGKDRVQAITYSLPLLDKHGDVYGIFGFEINLSYMERHYLPDNELPYKNSFYTLASAKESNDIDLSWFVPSGPIAQVYLEQIDHLPLTPVRSHSFYETQIKGLEPMYVIHSDIQLYSANSPYAEDNWTLYTFASQSEIHEATSGARKTLFISILLTTVLAFVAVFVLTYFSTRQISQLPEEIRQFDPYKEVSFEKTGLREIDDLTSSIEMLNRNIINSSEITSKILELTSMPMGGFEVSDDSSFVDVTDYVRNLMKKKRGESVSKEEWNAFYHGITAESMGVGHENVYKYIDPSAALDKEPVKWLRIQQEATERGYVGSILDVTEDILRNQQLAKELDYDSLTGLYNRVAFKRESYSLLQENTDKVGAMIFADLDNLKYINDNYGHDMGDRLLMKAGEMFDRFNQYNGIVSRISGDEFAVFLHGYESEDEIRNILSKELATLPDYYIRTSENSVQRVRFSGGVAWYPSDSDNITDLLKLSDYAMYEAKSKSKGSIFEFDDESYQENVFLLENREAINQLLDDQMIRFDFQPIVSLKSGEVFGYEALMRPLLKNFQSPLEILAVASAESKLAQLEHAVVMQAYQYIAENILKIGSKKIFVNSIPDQILTQEDHELLQRRFSHIFENVIVEITEEKDLPLAMLKEKMAGIKQRASMIAIDDYCAGYSNEIRVLSLEPDIIKIDMAIIQGISYDRDKQQLVSNIISFCQKKGVLTIAEGIESLEDLEMLIEMDIDFAQGFLLGRPHFEPQEANKDVVAYIQKRNHVLPPHTEDA